MTGQKAEKREKEKEEKEKKEKKEEEKKEKKEEEEKEEENYCVRDGRVETLKALQEVLAEITQQKLVVIRTKRKPCC